jgi:putative hydrolase of the HAD superfamily
MFDLIAFDADDTLWHNEILYSDAQNKLATLLAAYTDSETVIQRLYETEMSNLELYGYGAKSFTLSMIETAIKLSEGKIPGSEIKKIIGFAREMLTSKTQLLEHVETTIRELAQSYQLMVITKGDLLDQQAKLDRSRLGDYFQHVEVVSDKSPATYKALLAKYGFEVQDFLMVGNSLKSDILPVLALGGRAVYIPYHTTWAHEAVDSKPVEHNGYYELEHIGQLSQLLERLKDNTT